jgi:hypothetical protein
VGRGFTLSKLNLTEVKVFFVLSMIVPLGLLTSFRFAGVLPEPPTLATVATEPISWQIDRPRAIVHINDLVERPFTNAEISLKTGFYIVEYTENLFDNAIYLGRDGLEIEVFANVAVKSDFSMSLSIVFYPADNSSFVWVSEDFQIRNNITITSIREIGTNASEAYILATPTNRTMNFGAIAHWIFENDNPEDHQLKIVFEFTYRNASVYEKVRVPMVLTMLKDTGDTFEASRQVQAGEYLGSLDNVDTIDMYNVTVQEGQTLAVTLTPPEDANYDIYLYDSNRDVMANSTQGQDSQETITYTASASQDYYLKVIQIDWPGHSSEGPYTLKIETKA